MERKRKLPSSSSTQQAKTKHSSQRKKQAKTKQSSQRKKQATENEFASHQLKQRPLLDAIHEYTQVSKNPPFFTKELDEEFSSITGLGQLFDVQKIHVFNVLQYFLDYSNTAAMQTMQDTQDTQDIQDIQTNSKNKTFKKNIVLEMSDPGFGKTFTSLAVGKCLYLLNLISGVVVIPALNDTGAADWSYAISLLGMKSIVSLIDSSSSYRTMSKREKNNLFIFDEFCSINSFDDELGNNRGVSGKNTVIRDNNTKFIILISTCLQSFEYIDSLLVNANVMDWPLKCESVFGAKNKFFNGIKFHLGEHVVGNCEKFQFQRTEDKNILDGKIIEELNDVLNTEYFVSRITFKNATLVRKKLMNMLFQFLPFVKKTKFSFAQSRICSIVEEKNNQSFIRQSEDFLKIYFCHLEQFDLNCTIINQLDQLHHMYECLMIPSMCMLAMQHSNIETDKVVDILQVIHSSRHIDQASVVNVFMKAFKNKISFIVNLPQIKKILKKCNDNGIEDILQKNTLFPFNFDNQQPQPSSDETIVFEELQDEISLVRNTMSKTVICISDANYIKLISYMDQMELEHRDFDIHTTSFSKGIEILRIGDVKRENNYSGYSIAWNVFSCPFTDPGRNEILFSRFARINNATTSRCHLVVSSMKHFFFMFRFGQNKNVLSLRNLRISKSFVEVISKQSKTPLSLYEMCFDQSMLQTHLKKLIVAIKHQSLDDKINQTFGKLKNCVQSSSGMFLSELTNDDKAFTRFDIPDRWHVKNDIFLRQMTMKIPEGARRVTVTFTNSDGTECTASETLGNEMFVKFSPDQFITKQFEDYGDEERMFASFFQNQGADQPNGVLNTVFDDNFNSIPFACQTGQTYSIPNANGDEIIDRSDSFRKADGNFQTLNLSDIANWQDQTDDFVWSHPTPIPFDLHSTKKREGEKFL
jgi:hypothetical protein